MTNETKKQEDFNFTTAHRVSYADIITPTTFVKGKPKIVGPGPNAKYSGTFVIDPTPKMVQQDGKEIDMSDLGRLKREVIKLLNAHNTSGKKLKIGRLTEEQEAANSHIEVQVPWRDGTKDADKAKSKGKDNGEVFRDQTLLKATSKYQPSLSVIENKQIVELETPEAIAASEKFFYSGAYVVPSLGLHWYKGDEGKPDGVSLYLNGLMFFKHGPRLGGSRKSAAEMFKSFVGTISAEDPTGGVTNDELDEEIPF